MGMGLVGGAPLQMPGAPGVPLQPPGGKASGMPVPPPPSGVPALSLPPPPALPPGGIGGIMPGMTSPQPPPVNAAGVGGSPHANIVMPPAPSAPAFHSNATFSMPTPSASSFPGPP